MLVQISEDLVQEFQAHQDRLSEVLALGLRQLKVQEALALYARGVVSMGRAAELAGVHRQEMVRQAVAAGMQPRWTEEMVAEELA
jgi:predicted HTH domain antitoxin